ncbi:MAG: hypothetical protein ACP5KA_02125 [Desulfurococcaceae archaeon]
MWRKDESRVLVYGFCGDYAAFATYRADFLEELHIARKAEVLDLARYLREKLKTFDELSYAVSCTSSKYTRFISGLSLLEGSDYLLAALRLCELIKLVLCMLCKRGLISPLSVEQSIEISNKCLFVEEHP